MKQINTSYIFWLRILKRYCLKYFAPKLFTTCTFVRKGKVEMIDSTLVKFKTSRNIF